MSAIQGLSTRSAYEHIRFYEQTLAEGGFGRPDAAREHLDEMKRELRKRIHEVDESDRRIIKDYGIDGFIVRFALPSWVEDMETAEEWFDENERRECRPTMYDCTGDAFTSWHSIFKINGRYICYHSIGFDV